MIELLVVIAIIGILAAVVLANLSTARAKGRDAKRVSDLQNMSKAIAIGDADNPIPSLLVALGGANCAAAANSKANTCTYPVDLSAFGDPSVGTAGAACTVASASSCQYSISDAAGGTDATTQDYRICTRLETVTNFGAAGLYKITSTNASISAGCP